MPTILRLQVVLLLAVCSAAVWGQQSPAKADDEKLKPLAENAPKDQPKDLHGKEGVSDFEKAIAPYVAKARRTLPETKKRFQKGLKPGEVLSLTIRIYDDAGRFEQVFLQVKSWKDTTIVGLLSTPPELVKTHKQGEKMTFAEKDVYDWTISKPDGSEEGNFVGKFLDTYHP